MSPAGSSVTPATYTFRVRIPAACTPQPMAGRSGVSSSSPANTRSATWARPSHWPSASTTRICGRSSSAASPGTTRSSTPARRRRTIGGQHAADRLRIRDAPAGKEFLFLFDYGDEWHFGVQLVRTATARQPDAQYPQVVASHGQAPPQYLRSRTTGTSRPTRSSPSGSRPKPRRSRSYGRRCRPRGWSCCRSGAGSGLPPPAGWPRPARPCRRDDPAGRRVDPAAGR